MERHVAALGAMSGGIGEGGSETFCPTFGGMGQGAKDSSSGVWSFLSGPALVMVMRVALSA